MVRQFFLHGKRARECPVTTISALLTIAAATLPTQGSAQGREGAVEDGEVEEIVVTGSRLPSAESLSASPVVVLDRGSIDNAGESSLGDLLRNIPAVTSGLSDGAGRGGGGESTVALRGLDAVNTLVLVNGRRVLSNDDDGQVDLNSIPFEAIERIEVLKDGASPVYGADAIAGVVNIIMSRDFEGLKLQAEYGQSDRGDAQTREINATYGKVFDGGNFMFSVSHKDTDGYLLGDRPISADADQRRFGGGNLRTPIPEVALVTGLDPNDPERQLILREGVQQATSIDDFRDFIFTTGLPAPTQEEDGVNFFAFDSGAADIEVSNFWLSGNTELFDAGGLDAEAFIEATFTRRDSEGFTGEPNFGQVFGDPVIVSANNDFNPFGVDLSVNRKIGEADKRRNNTEQNKTGIAFGLRGAVGVFEKSWNWDITYSTQTLDQLTDGGQGVVRSRLRQAAGDSDVCRALGNGCIPINVLGADGTITQEMVDFISADDFAKVDASMDDFLFNVRGTLFSLPAGEVDLAAGLEYREDEFSRAADSFSNANGFINQVVTPDANPPAREVKELYGETNVPVLGGLPLIESFDVNFAVRYSDFNTFGDTTNWRIGLAWRPVDELMVRATRSIGFRIPTFEESFGGQTRGFESIVDPCQSDDFVSLPGCNGRRAEILATTGAFVVSGGNPELEPEESTGYTAGIVWTPSYVPGFNMTADYWRIEKTDVIARSNANFILDQNARFGLFPDLVIRDTETNAVTDVLAFLNNLGEQTLEGIDVALEYGTQELSFGSFAFRLDFSFLDSLKLSPSPGEEPTERAGTFSNNLRTLAELRSSGSVQWEYGDLSAVYSYRFVDGVDNFEATAVFPDRFQEVDSFIQNDILVSYELDDLLNSGYTTKVTFGAENILDEDPPFIDGNFTGGFDSQVFNSRGRFFFVRFEVEH